MTIIFGQKNVHLFLFGGCGEVLENGILLKIPSQGNIKCRTMKPAINLKYGEGGDWVGLTLEGGDLAGGIQN